jgi:hypothetical protein
MDAATMGRKHGLEMMGIWPVDRYPPWFGKMTQSFGLPGLQSELHRAIHCPALSCECRLPVR